MDAQRFIAVYSFDRVCWRSYFVVGSQTKFRTKRKTSMRFLVRSLALLAILVAPAALKADTLYSADFSGAFSTQALERPSMGFAAHLSVAVLVVPLCLTQIRFLLAEVGS
jgi:hypothetical protein